MTNINTYLIFFYAFTTLLAVSFGLIGYFGTRHRMAH